MLSKTLQLCLSLLCFTFFSGAQTKVQPFQGGTGIDSSTSTGCAHVTGGVWSVTNCGSGGGAVDSVNGQTGTVVLQAKDIGALPTVNVQGAPWNAVCNDTADDTIAIAAAINSVNSAGGGTVYIPGGPSAIKCKTTATLTVPRRVHLIGAGKNISYIHYTGAGTALVVADSNTADNVNGLIQGLTLQGPVADGTGSSLGLYYGGDPSNTLSPSASLGVNIVTRDFSVTGFHMAQSFGNNAFLDTWDTTDFYLDGGGVFVFTGTTNSGENMRFVNSNIANLFTDPAITSNDNLYTFNLINTSVDYMSGGQNSFTCTSGVLHVKMFGGNLERQTGRFVNTPATCNADLAFIGSYILVNGAGSQADMFHFTAGGGGSKLAITNNTVVYSNSTVTAAIDAEDTSTYATIDQAVWGGSITAPMNNHSVDTGKRICNTPGLTNLNCPTTSGGGGSLSGMTTGQVPIAATATTVTSSKPISGSGTGLTSGPNSGVTAGDVAVFTGTLGQITDGAIAGANLATLTGTQTFTGAKSFSSSVTLTSFTGSTQCMTVNSSGVIGVTGTPCGAGSTGISGLTAGFIPKAGSGTTITANSAIDDGVTTASTITITEPVVVNASGNGIAAVEGTAPSGVAASDLIYPDSTAHRWKMNNNNGGAVTVASLSDLASSSAFGVAKVDGTSITASAGVISSVNTGIIPSGASLPSPAADALFVNTSFPQMPGSTPAKYFFPGLLYYHNSIWGPLCPDSPNANCFEVLSNNGYGAANGTPNVEGDSLSVCSGCASASQSAFAQMAVVRGESNAGNGGVSGATCADQAYGVFLGGNKALARWWFETGINDLKNFGATVLPDYASCKRAEFIGAHGPSVLATAMSQSGSAWTAQTWHFQSNQAMATTTANDPLTTTVGGTALWVVHLPGASGTTAQMTVTIDGVAQTPVTSAFIASGYTSSHDVPFAIFYNMGPVPPGSTGHSISIAKTDGGSDPLWIREISANDHTSVVGGQQLLLSRMSAPGAGSVTLTASSLTANVATFSWSSSTLVPGQIVRFSGLTGNTFFNGTSCTVTASSAGTMTCPYVHANAGSAAESVILQGYGYGRWGGSDALVSQFNNILISEAQGMRFFGLNIGWVDARSADPCNTSSALCQDDGLHWTPAGHTVMSQFMFQQGSTAKQFGDTQNTYPPNPFSYLPTCSSTFEGQSRAVTDSSTATWGATVTGGGSNHIQAYCNSTNWTVAAK